MVLYGRTGTGHELIDHLEEGNRMARAVGVAIKPRILSDRDSGRTDRVVVEWEADSLDEILAVQTELWVYPEAPEQFQAWFDRLAELAEYAEIETWQLH